MSIRRVVVTGLGIVSPVAIGAAETWAGILAGRSGVARITRFDATGYASQVAGEVKGFDPAKYLPAKEVRRLDSFIHYGIAAGSEAIGDAQLKAAPETAERIGVIMGSGIGGLPMIEDMHSTLLKGGPRRVSPFLIPGTIVNMIAGTLSIMHGFKGPNLAIATACTTSTHSIGEAARIIRWGDADAIVAGGAEATVCPLAIAGFSSAKALSTRNDDPAGASRPWDTGRDGFVLSEGAGAVVLEEYEYARARGARIYAELVGYGTSADAYHMTAPSEDGDGARRCMINALKDARRAPNEVDYINAHGTSTPLGDIAESIAIKTCFGDHAKRVAVSSTKSMTGHLLGAAGAVEAIFTILSIRDQIAPPTINLTNQDPQCDLDYVPNTARKMKIRLAMSNSFGFGGTNGSLAFAALD